MQLNLLPAVKMEYIKAQRARRMVISVSTIVTIAAVALLLLLLSVSGLQKKHLSDLNKDIRSETTKLQNEPQINKMLTVQNQLGALTQLHSQEPAASKVFGYLNQVTPSDVSITDFNIDFTKQTATITGTSANLANVNQYVDSLKHATYTTKGDNTAHAAFSNVVLSSFSLNTDTNDPSQAANYTITLSYDPTIFDNTQNVTLTVPKLTTTRLTLDQGQSPTDLFKAAPTPSAGGGQ
ncbi:MAG TPA: PilN domain-containing protein [Candidatus Saccharimonadales bacterium]|nr:PilN domain-containing protein [Candidatus Saccharimonadales bacterium]